MRYRINYQEAGSTMQPSPVQPSPTTSIDTNLLIRKLNEQKRLLDSALGPDNWAFTGSSAVILYALANNVGLTGLTTPNDTDVLYKSDLNEIRIPYIGDYRREQQTLERSAKFVNGSNESIDVLLLKKLRKNTIMGLPVINLKFLLDQYRDPLSGVRTEVDNVKIRVLENVLVNNPNVDPPVVQEPVKTDMKPKRLFDFFV
jgi:hypothetical protein